MIAIVGIVLQKKHKKRDYLKSTDRRIDIGPAGRNLFISRDKQAQDKAARRLKVWMRLVIALVILAAAAAAGLFIAFYLVPYFHAEFQIGGTGSSSRQEASLSSDLTASLPVYDNMGLPVYEDEVSLFVINENSPAEADFVPELTQVGGVQADSRIADALRLMISAAKQDGLALVFTEGYVSYEEQEKRYEAKVKELMEGPEALTTVMAKTEAKALAPAAGESDQQTGLCLRLSGDPETFGSSKTASWLRNNMGKYGFVFRYPEGKEEETGCAADLTVIRYVGSGNAAAMQQRSMCLEEYISALNSQ